MPNSTPPIVQRDAKTLAAGYSPGMRALEIVSITVCFGLMAWVARDLWAHADRGGGTALLAAVVAWLCADFGSGMVHWAGDTWGTTDVPILGQSLIRTFREHHVDQTSISRHDFIETNGANCMATLPMLLGAAAIDLDIGGPVRMFAASFLLSLALWVFLTNQIHAWAHAESPPGFVRPLQRWRLVLSPEHHALHHAAPFARAYCITTGWMNPVLDTVDFWRKAERAITALTGALPRQDDIGEAAAVEIVRQAEPEGEAPRAAPTGASS